MEDGDLPEMTISKQRRGVTRLGGPICLRCDGEMQERRSETMSWSWRLNATTWMLNLGAETKRTGPYGVLSRFAPANPSPPPMPFLPLHLSLVLQQPACFPSQINIHTYSLSTPLVHGSHLCPMSNLALLLPSPPISKERKRTRLKKKSCPFREESIKLVNMAGRYSFSDGEGPAKNARSRRPRVCLL